MLDAPWNPCDGCRSRWRMPQLADGGVARCGRGLPQTSRRRRGGVQAAECHKRHGGVA